MAMCPSSDRFGRLGFIDKRVYGSFVWFYAALAMRSCTKAFSRHRNCHRCQTRLCLWSVGGI